MPRPFSGRRKRFRSETPTQPPVHTATTTVGCAYAAICQRRQDICLTQTPIAKPVTPAWSARCHFT
ncbi:hypothetical protein GHK62_04665 [Sinorhizobium terangae]|uniref:Uncharacterized protein n=1 Tax=Sinorhizobium terangae TaxID=110322 RepID=A0A6N7L8D3_SINTE|nr:hypothetical protein [Sinorhizobium terangae]